MKKSRIVILSALLILAMALVAGCGGGTDNAPPQSKQTQQAMPAGDPLPMMKDMGQQLQDMTRYIKAGQMMEAQKAAAQMASLADKVMPHMTDTALKEKMKTAAYDLRDTMTSAKVDQSVAEAKIKAMQDVMQPAMGHLQSTTHKH